MAEGGHHVQQRRGLRDVGVDEGLQKIHALGESLLEVVGLLQDRDDRGGDNPELRRVRCPQGLSQGSDQRVVGGRAL